MSLRLALACFVVFVSLPCTSHGHPPAMHTNSSKHRRGHRVKHKRRLATKKSTNDASAPAAKPVGQHSQHTRKLSALTKKAAIKHEIASSSAGAGETRVAARGQKITTGTLEVNGPLPPDFTERFIQAVAKAAKIQTSQVHVLDSHPYVGPNHPAGLFEIKFSAPESAVSTILGEATDPDSDLLKTPLSWYLIEHDEGAEPPEDQGDEIEEVDKVDKVDKAHAATASGASLDVDTEMPFGELAPFGREDTAKELTEQAIDESNAMVDQLERAEVAEEKRAIFRALTRLRGAAITSFDGIARSQTGNIDQYNAVNKWRAAHPVQHLAQEESDISAWAFPSQSD